MLDLEAFVGEIHRYLERAFAPVLARLKTLEQRAPERGERGEPGPAGKDGRDGVDGKNGTDGKSITLDAVRPLIEESIARIPVPKNGSDGKDGRDGRDGIDGRSVTLDDVRPILDSAIDRFALDLERRAQDILQRAIDRIEKPKDGAPGKDGRDGLGFEDLEVLHDGERTITLRFSRAGIVKEFPIIIPAVLERGVFRQGESYTKGDGVTWGGSYWIAQRDTGDKPGDSDAWRLAVKRGRDGRDGEKGERGPEGPAGRPAPAVTQLSASNIR